MHTTDAGIKESLINATFEAKSHPVDNHWLRDLDMDSNPDPWFSPVLKWKRY
jgi:hypothetical protein